MPTVTVIQPTIAEEKSGIIRCAAYCRVSSDSENQLNSFMAQLKYYENFLAGSETETLINVYADEGITGTREEKREEFQRMMNDCRKGKIDRIYTKSISRFASGSGGIDFNFTKYEVEHKKAYGKRRLCAPPCSIWLSNGK